MWKQDFKQRCSKKSQTSQQRPKWKKNNIIIVFTALYATMIYKGKKGKHIGMKFNKVAIHVSYQEFDPDDAMKIDRFDFVSK